MPTLSFKLTLYHATVEQAEVYLQHLYKNINLPLKPNSCLERYDDIEFEQRTEHVIKIETESDLQKIITKIIELVARVNLTLRKAIEERDIGDTSFIAVTLQNLEHFNVKPQLRHYIRTRAIKLGITTKHKCFLQTYFRNYKFGKSMVDLSNIMTAFGFDKDSFATVFDHATQRIQCCFPNIRQKADQNGEKRLIQINIPYRALRRCVLNVNKKANNNVNVECFLQVSHPPQLFIRLLLKDQGKRPPRRFLTWDNDEKTKLAFEHCNMVLVEFEDMTVIDFFDVFTTLQRAMERKIEFFPMEQENLMTLDRFINNPLNSAVGLPLYMRKLTDQKYFPLAYAIQALIAVRGSMTVLFFHPDSILFATFVKKVIKMYDDDLENDPSAVIPRTIAILESMVNYVQSNLNIPDPVVLLDYLTKKYVPTTEEIVRMQEKGFMRVRRIIVTPTRILLGVPEFMMGNRSLRAQGADRMLRVLFRDDDGMQLQQLPSELLIKIVKNMLLNDEFFIGLQKFSYLGSSNSQMRDSGTYFLRGSAADVIEARKTFGKFKSSEGVAKMMSRLGQVFTQSRNAEIDLPYEAYSQSFDYIGGKDRNGKEYTFSDGVGMISERFAKRIALDHEIVNCVPSVYQIRFRGYKGIVAVSRMFDRAREQAEADGIEIKIDPVTKKLPWFAQDVIFRGSQSKFYAPPSNRIEIVKVSAPISMSLNRPLINIMDQVSEMHGSECHSRVTKRIFGLLEADINRLLLPLVDEHQAMITLGEFPKLIHYNLLTDFKVTDDPFFSAMLRTSAQIGLRRLVEKMQIRIPTSHGRMMFGIVDELGILTYGQVFIQFTVNAACKYPTREMKRVVLNGPVMITKNPSVVAGDLRMFEAVDIPALHYLCDVVVFPRFGPRPHPDEMAGSDLDGDEYSIMWDSELFIDHNEPAFDFTPPKKKPIIDDALSEEERHAQLSRKMADFFTDYISSNSVGTIATSYLVAADLYGINSGVCYSLAIKHSHAVDFPKSAIAPKPLTKTWIREHPPETIRRYPDYMQRPMGATYVSNRLLGHLYRYVLDILERIRFESHTELPPPMNGSFILRSLFYECEDVGKYVKQAEQKYHEYSTAIESLCESYGIRTEAELFTGQFNALKTKVSDRDTDSMTFYNTQHTILERLHEIYYSHRKDFFAEFGGIEACTRVDESRQFQATSDVRVTKRICFDPSLKMRQKAAAYYFVAYTRQKNFAFAWLVADIHSFTMDQWRRAHTDDLTFERFSNFPLGYFLSRRIANAIAQGSVLWTENSKYCDAAEKTQQEPEKAEEFGIHPKVAEYHRDVPGFGNLVAYLRAWAKFHKLHIAEQDTDGPPIDLFHLDLLFLMHAEGSIAGVGGAWLTVKHNIRADEGGCGRYFYTFLQFLTTRYFETMDSLTFEPHSTHTWSQAQCRRLSHVAAATFYPIVVNRRFSGLPDSSPEERIVREHALEGGIFTIEIPAMNYGKDDPSVVRDLKKIAKAFGCSYCAVTEQEAWHGVKKYTIRPVGLIHQIRNFREYLSVSPDLNEPDLRMRTDCLPQKVYAKIKHFNRV